MKKLTYAGLGIASLLLIVRFLWVYYSPVTAMKYALCTLVHCTIYWLICSKEHEKAHWRKAEEYHELTNPRMDNDHFNCSNWKDFSPEEVKNVALAGINFDKKANSLFLPLVFIQPFTIIFTIITMFGNAVPVRFSKDSATDGYWCHHPEEFLEVKQQ